MKKVESSARTIWIWWEEGGGGDFSPSGGKPYETGVVRRNDNAWVRLQGGSWNPRLSKQRRQENYAELCR